MPIKTTTTANETFKNNGLTTTLENLSTLLFLSFSIPINPDNPLGAKRYDFPTSVRPELVEGY